MSTARATERTALILEPVTKHWCAVFPLIHHMLDRGMRVTLVGPDVFREQIACDLSAHPGRDRLVFVPFRTWSIWTVLHARYDMISVLPRCYAARSRRPAFRQSAGGLVRLLLFLVFVLRIPRRTIVLLELHQLRTLTQLQGPLTSWERFPHRRIELLLNRLVLGRTDIINVLDEPIATAVRESSVGVPVLLLPPAVFSDASGLARPFDDKHLHVVLPGRIDARRRDYDWLSRLDDELAGRLHITLAGTVAAPEDLRVLDTLRASGAAFDPRCDGSWIAGLQFRRVCLDADILLAPLKPELEDGRQLGRDTITGALIDALRFGKPLLLPDGIPIGDQYRPSVMTYRTSEELLEILGRFARDEQTLAALQASARANSMRYTAEKLTYLDQVQNRGPYSRRGRTNRTAHDRN